MKREHFVLFPPLSTTVPSSYKLLCPTKLSRLEQWSNSNQQFVSLYDREHGSSNGNVFIPLPLIETLPRKEQKLTFCDKRTAQQGERVCSRSSAYKLAVRKEKTSMWPHSSSPWNFGRSTNTSGKLAAKRTRIHTPRKERRHDDERRGNKPRISRELT